MTERVPATLRQGAVDLDALVARIRAEFADLVVRHAVLNDEGEDHAVVIVDDAWVFRFPRNAEAASFAAGERRLLDRLAEVSNVAVPRYELVSADGDFGGYRMIAGAELTPAVFAGLPRAAQGRVLDELGTFLTVLHGLPPELVAPPHGSPPMRPTAADRARLYAERRGVYAAALPESLLGRVDAFFGALPHAIDSPERRLVHGDLTDDHILLAPNRERLSGVIDFTDAGLGDTAFDFTFLWAYGEQAPRRALSRYGAGSRTLAMLERSRWSFVRYRIDQLWWNAMGYRPYDVAAIEADLTHELGKLGL